MELARSVEGMAPRGIGAAAGAPVARPARPVVRTPFPPAKDPHSGRREASRQVENGRAIWRIGCGDMINRDRCMTVFVDHGEVVVVSPPGESARLSAQQAGQLRAALNEAAKFAER